MQSNCAMGSIVVVQLCNGKHCCSPTVRAMGSGSARNTAAVVVQLCSVKTGSALLRHHWPGIICPKLHRHRHNSDREGISDSLCEAPWPPPCCLRGARRQLRLHFHTLTNRPGHRWCTAVSPHRARAVLPQYLRCTGAVSGTALVLASICHSASTAAVSGTVSGTALVQRQY